MLKQRFWNHSALAVLLAAPLSGAWAPAVPNPGERVESLVTFGAQSDKQWGDDNFSQTFFFLVPEKQRTFDADNAATLNVCSIAKNGPALLHHSAGRPAPATSTTSM